MSKNGSTHGFGLAVFSLILLALAFVTIFYFENCILASIIAFLSAILAAAAYIEARRASGPRHFTLTTLVISVLGALFTLIWTGAISRIEKEESQEIIIQPPEKEEEQEDKEEKLKELEEVVEELESDTIKE